MQNSKIDCNPQQVNENNQTHHYSSYDDLNQEYEYNPQDKETIPQNNHRKHPHYSEKNQRTTNKKVPKEKSCTKNSRIRVVEDAPTSTQTKKKSKKKSRNKRKKENTTPARDKVPVPRKRLFQNPEEDELEIEIVPVDTDLEVLLVNSCKIDAPKIQTIVEDFIRDKKYTTITA